MLDAPSDQKPEPVTARIARIIDQTPGWTPPDQLLALHMLAVVTAPLGGDVLEVGSWCGRSTAVLGHAVAASGTGHVWAVDLFPRGEDWRTNPDGSHSMSVDLGDRRVAGYEEQTVWDEPFRKDIQTVYERFEGALDAFMHTIRTEELTETVTPFRGTSEMFVRQASPNLRVRLAFLDGDHSYDAVCADIEAAERVLLPGGWLAFDDAFSVYDGVDAAIRERVLASGRYEGAHQLSRKFFAARRKA